MIKQSGEFTPARAIRGGNENAKIFNAPQPDGRTERSLSP